MSTTTQDTGIVIAAERIWDGSAEAPSAGEVLIQDGCISDLGASVAHPPGAPVIELKDHTLTPGFIDCHVHTTVLEGVFDNVYMNTVSQKTLFALNAFYILLGNGFTTVRDVGCFDPSFISVSLRNAQAAGQIIGPSLLVAPHLLSARGGHGDTTVLVGFQFDPLEFNVADGEAAIIEAVRRDYRGGADWIKFAATGGFSTPSDDPSQTTYSQDEMDVLVSTARDLGLYASPHAYGDEGIQRAIKAGVRSIEHGNLASAATLKLAAEHDVWFVPTQYTVLDKAENANNPSYWVHRSPWQHAKYQKYRQDLLDSAQNLAASDVRVAYGTDAGTFPFWDNVKEFQALVKYGTSPRDALIAATSGAAQMLGLADRGRLAAGLRADLVAMPGNPFSDITVTAQVDLVMQQGRLFAKTIAEGRQWLGDQAEAPLLQVLPTPTGPAATR